MADDLYVIKVLVAELDVVGGQWRAGSCLPGEARVHLESWRPLFTL